MKPPDETPRVLVVDGDKNLASVMAVALRLDGIETDCAANAADALCMAGPFGPNVIVMDVDLNDIDGFEMVRILREAGSAAPVIFATARAALEDRLVGLSLGNDYMIKPVAIPELVARVRVALRRCDHGPDQHVLRLLDLEVDLASHHVSRNKHTIALSPTEFRLLQYLLINRGRVLSRAQIFHHVWHDEYNGGRYLVETYISYLRRKIDRSGPTLIHTVRGVGYCVRVDV